MRIWKIVLLMSVLVGGVAATMPGFAATYRFNVKDKHAQVNGVFVDGRANISTRDEGTRLQRAFPPPGEGFAIVKLIAKGSGRGLMTAHFRHQTPGLAKKLTKQLINGVVSELRVKVYLVSDLDPETIEVVTDTDVLLEYNFSIRVSTIQDDRTPLSVSISGNLDTSMPRPGPLGTSTKPSLM